MDELRVKTCNYIIQFPLKDKKTDMNSKLQKEEKCKNNNDGGGRADRRRSRAALQRGVEAERTSEREASGGTSSS